MFTKLASYDKTIAELHSNRMMHNRQSRIEGEDFPSLRSSGSGSLFGRSLDSSGTSGSDNESSISSNSSSLISEENKSPISFSASKAFMASSRSSRILNQINLEEDELVKLSDVPLDAGYSLGNGIGLEKSTRSPSHVKDKLRTEYLAKIKNERMPGGSTFSVPTSQTPSPTTTLPPLSSLPLPPVPPVPASPPREGTEDKKTRRYSRLVGNIKIADLIEKENEELNSSRESTSEISTENGSDKVKELGLDKEKEKEKEREKEKEKEKEKKRDFDIYEKLAKKDKKAKIKEEKKEEKLKKKQEKKDLKLKAKSEKDKDRDSLSSPSPPPTAAHQLLGAVRSPRAAATLAQRGGSVDLTDDLAKRPIEPRDNALRRSLSTNAEDALWRRTSKIEKILGTPLPDNFLDLSDENANPGWRRTRRVDTIEKILGPLSEPIRSASAPPPPLASELDPPEIPQGRYTKNLKEYFGYDPQADNLNSPTPPTSPAAEDTTNGDKDMEIEEEEGILISEKVNGIPVIKGATLKKLVERLTYDAYHDTNFMKQFIITYRTFTNPHELLELLKARFEAVAEATEVESAGLLSKRKVVRIRVFNVVKHWVDNQWVDFMEDDSLVQKVLSFSDALVEEIPKAKLSIEKLVLKHTEGEKQKLIMFNKLPPRSHIPTVPIEKLQFADIHPEEIARQMTLMEYSLFKVIKPWEYLSWNTKQKQTKSANILAMITKFNVMSKWVQKEVLISGGESPRQRAVVIGKFLEVCEHLKELKNYNGIMEILSGLNTSSVHRLKLSWGCLSAKQKESFDEFNAFASGTNYKNLRTALHTLEPPCIPYLGMYLTDLTFINDGIPLYLPDSGLINFDKCRKVSTSVQELMQYQQTPYCLATVEDIQTFLAKAEPTQTEDDFYKVSLALEERVKV